MSASAIATSGVAAASVRGSSLLDPIARLAARVRGERSAPPSILLVGGWRDDLSSVTALVFDDDTDSRPSLVVKAGAGPAVPRIEAERSNLALLARLADPAIRDSVPRLLGESHEAGIALLAESVVAGDPVPYDADEETLLPLLDTATTWLLRFHAATGKPSCPLGEADVERHFIRPIRRYLDAFRPGAVERTWLTRLLERAATLVGRPVPLVLHHDDFCPQNLFVHGGRLSVIDWEAPLEERLPGFDLIHLLACAGGSTARGDTAAPSPEADGFRSFERVFLERTRLSQVAEDALGRYSRELSIDPHVMRLVLAVYWVEYALDKKEAPAHAARAFHLARLAEGTCVNVKRLAERERSIVLP